MAAPDVREQTMSWAVNECASNSQLPSKRSASKMPAAVQPNLHYQRSSGAYGWGFEDQHDRSRIIHNGGRIMEDQDALLAEGAGAVAAAAPAAPAGEAGAEVPPRLLSAAEARVLTERTSWQGAAVAGRPSRAPPHMLPFYFTQTAPASSAASVPRSVHDSGARTKRGEESQHHDADYRFGYTPSPTSLCIRAWDDIPPDLPNYSLRSGANREVVRGKLEPAQSHAHRSAPGPNPANADQTVAANRGGIDSSTAPAEDAGRRADFRVPYPFVAKPGTRAPDAALLHAGPGSTETPRAAGKGSRPLHRKDIHMTHHVRPVYYVGTMQQAKEGRMGGAFDLHRVARQPYPIAY